MAMAPKLARLLAGAGPIASVATMTMSGRPLVWYGVSFIMGKDKNNRSLTRYDRR